MCVSVNRKDTNYHQLQHDTLNVFRSTKTTSMSSSFVLLVIVVMDSSTIFIFICLMFLKWQVRGQENSLFISSATIETQYLTFDMAQYGPHGGVFSSKSFPR